MGGKQAGRCTVLKESKRKKHMKDICSCTTASSYYENIRQLTVHKSKGVAAAAAFQFWLAGGSSV
jgi:hypothetical protein